MQRYVKDYLPLQQGLRRFAIAKPCAYTEVKDYLPLQQGLRLFVKVILCIKGNVKDYLPLQQGLRLSRFTTIISLKACQRLSSITTRIKTAQTRSERFQGY